MLPTKEALIIISIVAVCTFLTRIAPFVIFGNNKPSKTVLNLGDVLPYTIIAILIVYCLKDVRWIGYPYGIPEILSIIVVIILHVWKKNSLISIGIGTVIYMLLVQNII